MTATKKYPRCAHHTLTKKILRWVTLDTVFQTKTKNPKIVSTNENAKNPAYNCPANG